MSEVPCMAVDLTTRGGLFRPTAAFGASQNAPVHLCCHILILLLKVKLFYSFDLQILVLVRFYISSINCKRRIATDVAPFQGYLRS